MKFLKTLSWIINIIAFLLAALVEEIAMTATGGGGMAIFFPLFLLLFVFLPLGLLLNFVLLYFEHKKHLHTKLTIFIIVLYIAFFIYLSL